MEEAIWALIEEPVYMLGGLLVAWAMMLSILFALVDSLRVDRFKVFSKRFLAHIFGR